MFKFNPRKSTFMAVEISPVLYELTAVLVMTPILLLFALQLKTYYAGKKETVIGQLTFLMAIIWLETFSQLFTEFWSPIRVFTLNLPPIHTIAEIAVFGYLSAILWNLWWEDTDRRIG